MRTVDGSRLIGINGIDTIIQNLGDDFIMYDTETNKCKNTQLGIEQFIVLEYETLFFFK